MTENTNEALIAAARTSTTSHVEDVRKLARQLAAALERADRWIAQAVAYDCEHLSYTGDLCDSCGMPSGLHESPDAPPARDPLVLETAARALHPAGWTTNRVHHEVYRDRAANVVAAVEPLIQFDLRVRIACDIITGLCQQTTDRIRSFRQHHQDDDQASWVFEHALTSTVQRCAAIAYGRDIERATVPEGTNLHIAEARS